jgi:glycosyltransferase involved in cell wall biosynthesis
MQPWNQGDVPALGGGTRRHGSASQDFGASAPLPIGGGPALPVERRKTVLLGDTEFESSTRPNVMLVGLFPPARGGMTTFLLNLASSYLVLTYRFEPFNISRPPKENVIDNWGYASFLRGGFRRIMTGLMLTSWRLIKFPFAVMTRRVDIIQVQASDYQQFWEAALYVAMARSLRRPVLMRLGGAFDLFYQNSPAWARRCIAAVIKLPDVLIVQSDYWRGVLAKVGRQEGMVVLNNFVSEEAIADERAGLSNAPTCLFIAGAEARRKGLDVVIEALCLLRDSGTSVRVIMIAVPEMATERIRAEGLDRLVELRGYMGREEVLKEMRRSEIFLLPSFGEGFPNSLLEAMAQGMAAIVTPVGSVPDVVGDGGGAVFVPPGDSVALANAVRSLVARPDLRARMSAQNQAVVKRRFTPQAVLPVLDQAYRQLLGGARPSGGG